MFASTGAWSLAYSYDADGNVVQRTTPYGSTVYGYSPGGRIRSTQQVPAGVGVEDSSSVGDKPGVAEFAYDALGYLERVQVGECVSSWVRDTSGAVMGYTEEVLGEPTSLVVHRRVWCRACGYAGILRGRLLGWKTPLRVPGVSTPMMLPAG